MSRDNFLIEKGLRITAQDDNTVFVDHLFGSATPGSAAQEDNASQGSIYLKTSDGTIWRKFAAGSGTGVWEKVPTYADLVSIGWRAAKAATGQAAPTFPQTRNLTTTPFTDDDGTTLAATDFIVGDLILYGVGGTAVLGQVTNVSSPSITIDVPTIALATGQNFVVVNYLPDVGNAQEQQALVNYNGSAFIKLGDINWNYADGITLNGYTPTTGPITGSDTVQVAINKLGGDENSLITLSGMARGSLNNGTFTGSTIPDNQTTKQALQALETELEGRAQVTGITTIQTVDSVFVDDLPVGAKAVKWLVQAFEEAAPANIQAVEIFAIHNGTASADATSVDDTIFAKLKLGSNFNLAFTIDLNGTGAAQVMRLRASSTSAGVTVTAKRLKVF
jgi:hypothetical protein